MNQEKKQCQNCKSEFTIEPDDFAFYEKIKVPAPTFCFHCRMQRRFSFRNDRTLFKRKCSRCEKDVISIYHKDSPYIVYCQSCWWSDKWDPLEYGTEYDFNKSFFEQFDALLKRVPIIANFVVDESRMLNSPYNNMVLDLKNCYLLTDSDFDEDCSYGCELEKSKNCVDTNLVSESELCYEVINCHKCYQTLWSQDCKACSDVWFSRDLHGCQSCFGCTNLRNQKYHIFNKPYTKEDYEKKLKQFNLTSYLNIAKHKARSKEFWGKSIHKYIHGIQNINVSGDYIYNSKNTYNSWIVYDGEDNKYLQYQVAPTTKDCYDISQFGAGTELSYEVLQGGNGISRVRGSWFVLNDSQDIDYGVQIMGSSNIFGCVSLRKKQYCILNKQYSKEEYESLREKIIKHMSDLPYEGDNGRKYSYGEFFPIEISPFAYNETTAQEYFPLTKEEIKKRGYNLWREPERRDYKVTIAPDDLPDSIEQVEDSVVREIVGCKHNAECKHACTKAFRIISSELAFYKQLKLPLPRLCPNCRHGERIELRNPPLTWHRQCVCDYEMYQNTAKHSHHPEGRCPNEFETSYAPERGEVVYCEQCYQSEVV
ncbi:MAG: hypothetical protein KJI72_00440 [Patescibacteria group bacterium]|nr:hypothetical protein [Patescibacteria group bacterium]